MRVEESIVAGPRVAIGALMQESNALCLNLAEIQDFENNYLVCGRNVTSSLRGTGTEMGGAIELLETKRCEIAPLIATHGGAGGIVSAACHARLRDELLDHLRSVAPVDALFLALHGAMVSETEDDVEGALLTDVRNVVGTVPLAVSCDLHAHITPVMMRLADILVGYQHYPHDDAPETAQRAVELMLRTLAGEIKPTMRMRKTPALFPAHHENTSGSGPMVDLNAAARTVEADGTVLAASYFPVQPWLDVPDMGFAAVTITDDDPTAADRVALDMAREAWARRREFDVETLTVAEAIERGNGSGEGTVVLVDSSDCVGGGATGDSAVALAALVANPISGEMLAHVVDAECVAAAARTGVDGRFAATIGNKIDRSRGEPVAIDVVVQNLFEGRFTYAGGIMGGVTATMGPSAVLAAGPVRVLVSTHASYEFADEQYRAAGLDVRAARFVVVKNPMNFRRAYDFAAATYILDTPGPTTPNLRSLSWTKNRRPFYPLDDDFQPRF